MKYRKITVFAKEEQLEEVCTRLTAAGFEGLEINDPKEVDALLSLKGTYAWDYIDDGLIEGIRNNPGVTLYIEENNDAAPALEIAKDYDYASAIVDDEDWLHIWEEYIVPAKISKSFVVKPKNKAYQAKGDEQIIEIDPGMAFGTGTNATTFLVIRHMENYMKEGFKVLDVGCGTGILSIAAEKLGASDVLAVDLDPEAIRSSRVNVQLNGCSKIDVRLGDLTKDVTYTADLVCANLMADLVKLLTTDIGRCLKTDGIYISSGILDEKEEELKSFIAGSGFEILEVNHSDGWCSIAAKKK